MNKITYVPPARPPEPVKVALTAGAALDLDQAELFLLSLDGETAALDLPRAAYLLGLAEAHIANLIEAIRSVAQ